MHFSVRYYRPLVVFKVKGETGDSISCFYSLHSRTTVIFLKLILDIF